MTVATSQTNYSDIAACLKERLNIILQYSNVYELCERPGIFDQWRCSWISTPLMFFLHSARICFRKESRLGGGDLCTYTAYPHRSQSICIALHTAQLCAYGIC